MEFVRIIDLILVLAGAFYLIIHLMLRLGLRQSRSTMTNEHPFVSIIVAARNEQSTIDKLLQCLLQQTYQQYEIIIVNDRSNDSTAEIINKYQIINSIIKRIDINNVPCDMPSKKNALRTGIEASRGEILCFTDADCFPPPNWVEKLVQLFEPNVGLVAGYSPYQIPLLHKQHFSDIIKDWFFKFIAYEEFRSAIWSAGSISLKHGWLCTGRNLAYRRVVYDAVNGFEKIKMSISGDDDLFLQLVRKYTNWQIKYTTAKDSFVPTIPPINLKAFIEQRKRHFSAAIYYTFSLQVFFFIYHLSNLLLFLTPIFYLLSIISFPVLIICLCSKLISDTLLIISSITNFNGYLFRRSYIFMEILYLLYNSIIGPLGLICKFEWKPI
jgi:cellulose synthase/poly-beta-1,6-N-acetylglucosamine synthase-like glycosyltransferase